MKNNFYTDVKLAILETKYSAINKSIKVVENKVEDQYEKIDVCMQRIESKIWSLFFWTIGGFCSVFLFLAHIKGWI